MRRRFLRKVGWSILSLVCISDSNIFLNAGQEATKQKHPSFERRIESRVAKFDAEGRPMVRAILDLADEYQIPLGIEYIDRDAVWRPLKLKLIDKSVREILERLVAQLPQYKLKVSSGVVEIYSPTARADASNLLNTTINHFESSNTPRMTSWALHDAMASERHQVPNLAGSVLEPGHEPKITLNLKGRRVYEILDDLVAQRGQSLWVPVVPPQKLSEPGPKLWEVYPLGAKDLVMDDLNRAFPPDKK